MRWATQRPDSRRQGAGAERLPGIGWSSSRDWTPGPADTSADPIRLIGRLAGAFVPRFAEFTAVHLMDELFGGRGASAPPLSTTVMRRIVSVDADAPGQYREAMPAGEIMRWRRESGILPALARGQSVHIPHLDTGAADRLAADLSSPDLAWVLHSRSVLLLPLVAHGVMLGNVLLVRGADRPSFTDADIAMCEHLALWAGEWVESVRQSRYEHHVARWLCRSARPWDPDHPVGVAGVESAYRCRPEGGPDRPGGDWCDVIAQPDGRTALVLGEVAGHTAETAVLVNECRTTIRALASLGLAPHRLLDRADQLVRRLGDEHGRGGELLVTCAYVLYDPATRRCGYASAGHLPPVLLPPGGRPTVLRPPAGVPLGVGGVAFESRTFGVVDGSLLALCSDGLAKAAGRDAEDGLRALAAWLDGGTRDPETICDEIVGRLTPGDVADDLTLLAARLQGPPRDGTAASPGARTGLDVPMAPVVARPGPVGPYPETVALVGRRQELATVEGLLRTARLVTLTGPGGTGKSRLVRHAATELGGRFPDGAGLVELPALRDPMDLARRVGEAVGAGRLSFRPRFQALVDHLADKRLLLVIDAVEHLTGPCAELVTEVLRGAPDVRILATGRRPLGMTGEHTVVIPPLEPPSDAVTFFVEHAKATGSTVAAADLPVVRDICRRLDGLPLALEFAAEQLGLLSLGELAARLDDQPGLLTGEAPRSSPRRRHHSLRASVGWSHELCEPLPRLLWARLSVFDAGFDLSAAEFVCADRSLPRAEVLYALSALVRDSIVLRAQGGAGTRYRMLNCIREYGIERLRHLDHERTLARYTAYTT